LGRRQVNHAIHGVGVTLAGYTAFFLPERKDFDFEITNPLN
jgi:hypothetical protein